MASYRGTIVSNRSAEETFDYMADFTNAAEWDPGTATSERLDIGPVGLDATFRLSVRIGSRVTPLDYRIVNYRRPHQVVLLGESETIRSEDTMTVTPTADGRCILTYDAELTLKGAFALTNPVLPLFFDRIGDKGVEGLRLALGGPPRVRDRPHAGAAVAGVIDKLLEATVIEASPPSVRRCGTGRRAGPHRRRCRARPSWSPAPPPDWDWPRLEEWRSWVPG